jgi:GT2 family glycosyltransferase/ADP-heptose:LPS heptosyltransferase
MGSGNNSDEMKLNPLRFTACLFEPKRLTVTDSWHGHFPFAFAVMQILKPRIFVELGTHRGDSYCAFCQAVDSLNLDVKCFAVDTWKGDEHSGLYGEEILKDLKAYHDPAYGKFSRLLQMTFDEALHEFTDGSVDLLHIDGLHTYEAVKHDFESWLPKMSDRGVILFHDIAVHERDFGVWKLWDELRGLYPSYEFSHSYGLGVLFVGQKLNGDLKNLVLSDKDFKQSVADFFSRLGERISLRSQAAIRDNRIESLASSVQELEQARSGQDLEIKNLRQALAEKDNRIESLASSVQELEQARSGQDLEIKNLRQALAEKDNLAEARLKEINLLQNSISWKIVKPLYLFLQMVFRVWRWKKFFWFHVKIEPFQQIEVLKGNLWRSLGSDPQFRVIGQSFPPGWYYLSAQIEFRPNLIGQMKLYIDSGSGFNERETVILKAFSNKVNEAFYLPHGAKQLRFDPTELPGTFALEEFSVAPSLWLSLRKFLAYYEDRLFRWQFASRGYLLARTVYQRIPIPGRVKFHLSQKVKCLFQRRYISNDYHDWIVAYDSLDDLDRCQIQQHISTFERKPVISIIMPVRNVSGPFLLSAIESVRKQNYPHWELCIFSDSNADVHKIIEKYLNQDTRIQVYYSDTIVELKDALKFASGDYVTFLGQSDMLSEHALYFMALELNNYPQANLIYSDEDKINEHGQRCDPYFKPDFSRDILFSQDMLSRLCVYQAEVLSGIDGFKFCLDFKDSQEWGLVLRCIERVGPHQIRHVPRILYHQRRISISNPPVEGAILARKIIQEYLDRHVPGAKVIPAESRPQSFQRVIYPLPEKVPLVSILLPSANYTILCNVIESIHAKTDYSCYEVLIDYNGKQLDIEMLDAIKKHPLVRIINTKPRAAGQDFNYSRIINNLAEAAHGDVLVFLNDDVDIINADWLRELVSNALRPEIGIVGAKLYYPDDTVQHGGVIVGMSGGAAHSHIRVPRGSHGYNFHLMLPRGSTAVTFACAAVRKELFVKAGKLDDINLPIAFNDVDFCLRLMSLGYQNLWIPYAELYHHESITRGHDNTPEKAKRCARENGYMKERWGVLYEQDPMYNPNLSIQYPSHALAWPPRLKLRPWQERSSNNHLAMEKRFLRKWEDVEDLYGCSIIILNKDKPELIRRCVESLRDTIAGQNCEILIGDTGSTNPDTLNYYKEVEGLCSIVYLGQYNFSKNNNDLARMARKSIFVFLNNDVFVTEGFPGNLLKYFYFPRVGVVGCKLLFENGSIQHAGMEFVSETGKFKYCGYHPGRLKDRNLPEANCVKIVPAVTGACLLIRKDIFFHIGGFDEGYQSESQDSDLCLKVREAGYQVIYDGTVNAVHLENGTRPVGDENWSDRRKFALRWGEYLDRMFDLGVTQSMPFKPRVLFVRERERGDVLASTAILREFKKRYPICHISFSTNYPDLVINNPFVDCVIKYSREVATESNFEETGYLSANLDIVADIQEGKFQSGRMHFERYGKNEGREINAGNIEGYDCVINLTYEVGNWEGEKWIETLFKSAGFRRSEITEKMKYPVFKILPDRDFENTLPEKFIVIGPNAGWPQKEWSYESWIYMVRMIQERFGMGVVQVGAEKDRLIKGCIDYRGISFNHLAVLIARANFFIGVDSFPMHMALAVLPKKKNMIILTCPTSQKNAFFGEATEIRDGKCEPCRKLYGDGREVLVCKLPGIKKISVERVFGVIESLLLDEKSQTAFVAL